MSGAALGSFLAVMRREYLQRVRSKWFLFATVAGPLLMGGLIFVPVYFQARSESSDRDLVVTDATQLLADRVVPGWRTQATRFASSPGVKTRSSDSLSKPSTATSADSSDSTTRRSARAPRLFSPCRAHRRYAD